MLDEVKAELDERFKNGDIGGAMSIAGGAFSACWDNLRGAGVFESTNAADLAEYLTAQIEAYVLRRLAAPRTVDAYSVRSGLMYPDAQAAADDAAMLGGGRHAAVDPHSASSPRHDPEAEQRGSER